MTKNSITLRVYVPLEETGMMPVDSSGNEAQYLEVSTGSSKVEGYVKCELSSQDTEIVREFEVSILDISFTKKMYQPNVVTAELYFAYKTSNTNDDNNQVFPTKSQVKETFLNKKVVLYCNEDSTVCNDYYVQKIETRYTKTDFYVTLTIYSPDYQMTIDKYCRTFVAKKLSTILNEQMDNFAIPFSKSAIQINSSNMQHVVKNGKEHIFPFLVQYNESYYDFLRRITNRWGEFLYYEDGKLNVGFNSSATTKKVDSFYSRSYLAIDAPATLESKYGMHVEATADSNMLNNPMAKGKYDMVKGEMNSLIHPSRDLDKYIMKKISSLFGNNKSLGSWAIEGLIDDIVNLSMAEVRSIQKNVSFNKKYFNDDDIEANADQYDSSQEKYNQFSEFTPFLNADEYGKILKMELTAGRDTMKIEFQTEFPSLKLGQIIEVADQEYLVVEFRGYQPSSESIYYEATCLPKCQIDGTTSAFYPTYLETGHILESGIQHASVTDADDPLRANRVRVRFDWQDDSQESSPWLLFAQEAATKKSGVHGRHYEGENVLVDFINGNIERPYVIGAVNQNIPALLKSSSIVLSSPAGHSLCVSDGTGAGLTAFLAGVTPGLKMIQGMLPGMDFFSLFGDNCKEFSNRFEGSTEIKDYYGIYSIKGSTDGRNVTIKSPWGDVKINAFTGITVSAPNGDIRLQGKNVTIEAGNNLKLISGTNIKNKFISRSNSDYGESIATMMADAATIAAKKLQALAMSLIDLSLVRNIIEVGFKPQEGLLEIQSNRYLKLEAGGARAGYPAAAYASKDKLEKEFKKDVNNMMKMAPSIAELITKIHPCVNSLISNYISLYKECCKKKSEFDEARIKLGLYSNTGNGFCNDYDALKTKLWNSETKEIKEADMGFAEAEVGTGDNSEVSGQCVGRNRLHFYTKNTDSNQKEHVLKKRKEHREDVLKKANALLKSIADLRKVHVKNYQRVFEVSVNDFYGTFERFIPKDFFDTFTKALDVERLKDTYFYDKMYKGNDNHIKSLKLTIISSFIDKNHLLALKRKVALNMMDDWGITKQKNNLQPNKPTTEAQLLGDEWTNYVNNLIIEDGAKIISNDTGIIGSIADTALNKINVARPIMEYKSWGNSKEGAILFSSGATYELGNPIKDVVTQYADGKFTKSDLGDDSDRKMEDFMEPIRTALKALGTATNVNNVNDNIGNNEDNNHNDNNE